MAGREPASDRDRLRTGCTHPHTVDVVEYLAVLVVHGLWFEHAQGAATSGVHHGDAGLVAACGVGCAGHGRRTTPEPVKEFETLAR